MQFSWNGIVYINYRYSSQKRKESPIKTWIANLISAMHETDGL